MASHAFVLGHPSNLSSPLRALARAYTYQFLKLLRIRRVVPLGVESRLYWDPSNANTIRVAYTNPPEYAEWRFWRRWLQSDSVFVDVGANVGIYTILALECGSSVIAFEPDPTNYRSLVANVGLNGYCERAVLLNLALGHHQGKAQFDAGLGPLSRVRTDFMIHNENMHDLGKDQIAVPLSTLDIQITSPITGLKVDVEGFEINVIRGAVGAITKGMIPVMQLEWNDLSNVHYGSGRDELGELLLNLGFSLWSFSEDGLVHPLTRQPQNDIIAIHESALDEIVSRGLASDGIA